MSEPNPLGNIFISHRAIASIAHVAAIESYGVVGLAGKNLAEDLANKIVKDPSKGVEVELKEDGIIIDLYIIVEYGTRIKMVTSSVAENVRYQIEKWLELPVKEVNVHVRGLRISDTD
jgi:uncharacterized alkaline shock family protein YloU